MSGVTRKEILYIFAGVYLVRAAVNPATSQSCLPLCASGGAQCDWEAKRQSVADNDNEI